MVEKTRARLAGGRGGGRGGRLWHSASRTSRRTSTLTGASRGDTLPGTMSIPRRCLSVTMNRRSVLGALGLVALPRAIGAQHPTKFHHIGFLPAGTSPAQRQQLE